MRLTHFAISLCLLVLPLTSCSADPGVQALNGVWTVWPGVSANSIDDAVYSWGEGITVRNGSIDIDLGSDPPTVRFGYIGGVFPVVSAERSGPETYRLVFTFTPGGFDVEWSIAMDGEDRMYVEQVGEGFDLQGVFGPSNPHYRVDGPDIDATPQRFPSE